MITAEHTESISSKQLEEFLRTWSEGELPELLGLLVGHYPRTSVGGEALVRSGSSLLDDVLRLIARAGVSSVPAAPQSSVPVYWRVGCRIGAGDSDAGRPRLKAEFGDGYSEQNILQMVQFANAFSETAAVTALSTPLVSLHGRTSSVDECKGSRSCQQLWKRTRSERFRALGWATQNP